MTRLTLASLLSFLLPGLAVADEPKTEKGFVSLFNGKSLDGWEIMNKGKFSVKEGVIKLDGGSGWLRSDKQYSNFVLRVDLRFMKKNQDGGIFLRATKEGGNWPKQRYEVQCHNDGSMARLYGTKYKLNRELAQKVLRKPGEWNSYDIKCDGKNIEVRLNGELVTTSDGLSRLTGYIGLQGERGYLEFRNIRIKKLP